ncbi:hypothetical protein TL16_g02001 [Triparma laevis f. inornata]|uniref:Tyrosine-protein kinase ephrin type A/B receptor-like domain-containing protein n=1 Tax=Triparma laevis f. inornata TaxID=1714386 RepID=A0A9W6ZSK5_9STRA|nr:hypothetical protein TL16_g02001 [Triparma laevis f. inornata]
MVYTKGSNQKGVCASLAEGGTPITTMCMPDDHDILRLIDREDDYSTCPDVEHGGPACEYWYNEAWVQVPKGGSSPFYGDCKKYASCMKGELTTLLACVECYDFDDYEVLSVEGSVPDVSTSTFAESLATHMCIDHDELTYYKTCDANERYDKKDFTQCPGSRRLGAGLSKHQEEFQTSIFMTMVEQFGSAQGMDRIGDIAASSADQLQQHLLNPLFGSLGAEEAPPMFRSFLYDGEAIILFEPPDPGCACYKECFREQKSLFEWKYPVYVCTECLPGYVPAKVATGFPGGERGFFYRDLKKCPNLNGDIKEYPTMCVKESIVDAGHYCPIETGTCASDLINITIEIEQLKNLPPFDNLNNDESWGRYMLDVYSKHSQFINEAAGGLLGWVTGGASKVVEGSSGLETLNTAATNTQYPNYYVSVRVAGRESWLVPKYTGIGSYFQEIGLYKMLKIDTDTLVWDNKLDVISGARIYREKENIVKFENVCPDSSIEFSVMDLDMAPQELFKMMMIDRQEISLDCENVPETDLCVPVNKSTEENVVSYCHQMRWPTPRESVLLQRQSPDRKKTEQFKKGYDAAHKHALAGLSFWESAKAKAGNWWNAGKNFLDDDKDECSILDLFDLASCFDKNEPVEKKQADQQQQADSLDELMDERTKTRFTFNIDYGCLQSSCLECFGASNSCTKCELGFGLHTPCTSKGFQTRNPNSTSVGSDSFKTTELGLRVTSTAGQKLGAAILPTFCQNHTTAGKEKLYWEVTTLNGRNMVIGVATDQADLTRSLLEDEENAAGINFAWYFEWYKGTIDSLLFGPATSTHDEYMEDFTRDDVHSSYKYVEKSMTRLRFALDQKTGELWFGINDEWIIGSPSRGVRPMFTLPKDRTWFPAVSKTDDITQLSSSAEIDVRFHIRESDFFFRVPRGFKAIEPEANNTARMPGKCEKCADGKISDGTGQCEACPPGSWRTGDEKECKRCPVGWRGWSEGGELEDCKICEPGSYASTGGSSKCEKCGLGSFASEEGANTCVACEKGKLANITGSLECTDCPKGKYTSTERSATCVPCGEGHFCNTMGMTSQLPCAAGSFSLSNGMRGVAECELCELGKFAGEPKSTKCANCNNGRYCDTNGTITPKYCVDPNEDVIVTKKTFTRNDGGSYSRCEPCESCDDAFDDNGNPLGQKLTGCNELGPVCVNCESGKYSNGVVCSNCERGKFSGPGALQCDLCNNGFMCPEEGSNKKIPCGAGNYSRGDEGAVTFCRACPQGKKSTEEKNRCELCTAGRYSLEGARGCSPCVSGSFSGAGQQSCSTCMPGKKSSSERDMCVICTAGRFSLEGASECSLCDPGTISGAGEQSCSSCMPGKKSSSERDKCELCETGRYSVEGSSSCKACAKGKFNNNPGSPSCSFCPASTFGDTNGMSECTKCRPNTFSNSQNSTQCIDCPAKSFSAEGSTACSACSDLNCEPGAFSEEGWSQCEACTPGKVSASESSTNCDDCASGKFASTSGSISCSNCEEGTYATDGGASGCKKCPVGTFSPESATDCTPCLEGAFSDQPGSSTCKVCPQTRYSYEKSSSCSICDVGYFSTPKNQGEQGEVDCQTCPDGASCAKPGTTVEDLDVKRGFWRSSRTSSNIVQCLNAAACPGSQLPASPSANDTDSNPNLHGTQDSTNSSDSKVLEDGPSDCADGYGGPLCLVCARGYSQSLAGGCNGCPDSSDTAMSIAGYALGFPAIIFVLFSLARKMAGGSLQEHVKKARNDRNHWGYSLRSKLKILASSWQIIGSLQDVLGLALPIVFTEFISTISDVVNLDYFSLLPLGCLVDTSFHNKLLVATLGPLFFYGCAFAIFVLREAVRPERNIELMKENFHTFVTASLIVSYAVFTSVSTTLFLTFRCEQYGDDLTWWLVEDPSIDCMSPGHKLYQAYALFMMLVYPLGTTLFYFFVLWFKREALKSPERDENEDLHSFTFLWDAYTPEMWYFEVLENVRRLSLSGILVFIAPKSKEQIAVGMLVSLLSVSVYSRARPYIKEEDNSLAITSQWSIFFTFFSSLLCKFNRLEVLALEGGINVDEGATVMGETNDGLMGVLLIIVNLLGVILFVLQLLLRLSKKISKLKHRHTGVIGGISRRDLKDEGVVAEYVKVLAQSGELEAGWTSMLKVNRFAKKLEGGRVKGEFRCSGGDGPVDQYRFVFDVKGSCEDCKGYVMNLEGDEREGEVEHSILQNHGGVVTKYIALELPQGKGGWTEQSDAVYKVKGHGSDFLLLQTIRAKRRGGRARADMLEGFQFRKKEGGMFTEVTYVSSCEFNVGLVGGLMLLNVEFKVCLRFVCDMIERLEGGKHIKKVESFGHEHVMVEGGRMGKGKGKGKEKGKEKREDLMCVNTNGLLEVQKKGGDGVELRKPSGNIIPPPSMPWAKMFDSETNTYYYQHTQDTTRYSWDKPDDYVE